MIVKTRKTETVRVSRLGCIRKSTVEVDQTGKSVEHIEVWTEGPKKPDTLPSVNLTKRKAKNGEHSTPDGDEGSDIQVHS